MRAGTPEAEYALLAYRELQERNGGDTRAGGRFAQWLREGEFGIIQQGERFENYESPMRIATYLALQLDAAGNPGAAMIFSTGARSPRPSCSAAGGTRSASSGIGRLVVVES